MKVQTALAVAILCALFARGGAAQSAGAAQPAYTRSHDLLAEAIRKGSAAGVMGGDVAEKFTSQFRSNGLLLVAADVIGSFARPDCKRMLVRYTKKDVLGPGGPQDVDFSVKLNYCLDGRPPAGLGAAQ